MIILIPIGHIEEDILLYLKGQLEKIFGMPVAIKGALKVPPCAFNSRRGQYLAPFILKMVAGLNLKGIKLAITDVDLYAPGLNFVFGEAWPEEKVAVISLARLTQQWYGLPEDKGILKERAVKEAVHEIGHLLGLSHCPDPRCVMHFSNSIIDTDIKTSHFCAKCRKRVLSV